MNRRTSIVSFAVPILVAWGVALVVSLSGMVGVVIAFVYLPLAAAMALACAALTVVYAVGRSRGEATGPLRQTGALAAGLALALITWVPAVWGAQWTVREARQPIRAELAERVIDRVESSGFRGQDEIALDGLSALLSDGGTIDVYVDDRGTSVWFWDFRGILDSYSASVYVRDADAASPPGGVTEQETMERESGHWWRPVTD